MFKLDFNMPDQPMVSVQNTENRGFSPEEVAERCGSKLSSVSAGANPAIRAHAMA